MFPIRDHNPSDRLPLITITLILVTSFVFFLQLSAPDFEGFITQYALIPNQVVFPNFTTLLPFLYSIFLHGGWLHIISNMWFLWIFGDNVEARMGHISFLFFYLVAGIAAGLVQYAFNPLSPIPTLGASGAVAGVLGGYIILYPSHKIDTLIPSFGGFMHRVQLPASIMLGYWFLIQLISGAGTFGVDVTGGVAWWAHIGGFLAGVVLIQFFRENKK